jgi:hypothetical protein
MLVRIRWEKPNGLSSGFQETALATAALLTPSALIAFTMALWSIAADLHWLSEFFIARGPFSHWQVWLIVAGALILAARVLERCGAPHEDLIRNESIGEIHT